MSDQKTSPLDVDFLLMLGLAFLFDLIIFIVKLIELFIAGTVPIVSGLISTAGAITVGRWLKSKDGPSSESGGENEAKSEEKKESKDAEKSKNKTSDQVKSTGKGKVGAGKKGVSGKLKQIIISWIVEKIPIVGMITPVWTLNVISALENKKNYYIVFATMIITTTVSLGILIGMVFPDPSMAGVGHSVLFPINADKDKLIEEISDYINKDKFDKSPYKHFCDINGTKGNCAKRFVEAGEKHNIHPTYLVAISVKESGLCTDTKSGPLCGLPNPGYPDFEFQDSCFNSWGRRQSVNTKKEEDNPSCWREENGPFQRKDTQVPPEEQKENTDYWTQYENWQQGIYQHANFLEIDYIDKGLTTVEEITEKYCPVSDGCDPEGYIKTIIDLVKEITPSFPLESIGVASGDVIELAKRQLNKPYSQESPPNNSWPWNNRPPENPPDAFDCSSLIGWAYYWGTKGQINLPRTTFYQWEHCEIVGNTKSGVSYTEAIKVAEPGDLLFKNGCNSSTGHVMLYIGNGELIHAAGVNIGIEITTSRNYPVCVCRIKTPQ